MQVVALVSQKGGAGKTTLAAGLAVSGERAGLSTVLVDLDPQASAAKWGDLRNAETPVVTTAPATRIARVLDASRAAGAALAILDTAPHSAEAALAAARASELVLIPCRASTADLHAIAASVDLVRIAGARAAAVLNAAPVQGPLADEALTALAGYDLAAAPVVMHQRIAHVYAFTVGLTAAELEPAGKASAELDALYRFVMHTLTGDTP